MPLYGPGRAWLLLVALCCVAGPARARAPTELSILAEGRCPAAERVERQLGPLLTETTLHLGRRPTTEVARVADQGERFTIQVRQVERVIQDAARDCEERARIAAVFIALVVDPPLPPVGDSGTSEPLLSPPVVKPKMPPPSPPPATTKEPRVATMAGATLAFAPGREGSRTWGMGPALRLLLGRDRWDVSLGAAFVSPTELDLKRGGVRLTRAPFDVSGSLLFGAPNLRGVVGAGLAGDLLHLTGSDVTRARSSVRFDVGFRAHLGLRVLFGSGFWGVAETSGRFFPRPYEFEVPPGGVVGQTPALWLAATVGALLEIR